MSISAEFFAFAREASASARAAGVSSLICDYLHMDLRPEEAQEVESILSLLLDDPSPLVRRAIAEGLAREADAPRHIILSLASDQSDIAALVLQHSPHFTDAELADIAWAADVGPQLAIARRAFVAMPVCAALSEAGPPCVLVELAANPRAVLSQTLMLQMLDRAGAEGRLRDALLMRADAGPQVRLRLLDDVSGALAGFLKRTGWLAPERAERILRDARERAIVELGARNEGTYQYGGGATGGSGASGAALSLVRHLRGQGQLTPALILRALVCGDRLMLAAAMAELAARPIERVLAHLDAPDSHAFAALYEKAGLPAAMQPVFVALLAAIARMPAGMRSDIRSGRKLDMRGVPERNLVRLALRASASMPDPSRLRLQAWLGRLEAESARAGLRRDIPAPV